METIWLSAYISRDTLYGDWSCTTFNLNTKEPIGEFCAESDMVVVFLLEEVLKYNSEFNYYAERPWTTTLIKNFDGEINFEVVHKKGTYEDDSESYLRGEWDDDLVRIVGIGNINFVSKQTGF